MIPENIHTHTTEDNIWVLIKSLLELFLREVWAETGRYQTHWNNKMNKYCWEWKSYYEAPLG